MTGLRKPWRMTVGVAAVVMALTAWSSARGQDLPAGLANVPADSEVVVIIANPQALDKKIADLAEKMGVSDPSMQSPLAHLKQEIGLIEGVKDDAAWLLVVQNVPMSSKPEEEIDELEEDMPAILLAPVTDYQAFLKNFDGGASQDGLTEVTMPDGTTGYVREVSGGYALLGASKQLVTSYEPAGGAAEAIKGRIGDSGVQAVGRSDVAVVLNMQTLGPKLEQEMKRAMEEAKERGEVMQEYGGGPAGPISSEKATEIALSLTQIWVRDLQGAVLGADLTDQGVGLSCQGVWKPGSVIAGRFKGGLSAGSLMARLPKTTYLFAGALSAKAIDLPAMLNDVTELLKDSPEPFVKMMLASVESQKLVESAAFTAELSPDFNPVMPGNPFRTTAVSQSADGQAIIEAIKTSLAAMGKIELPLPQAQAGPGQPTVKPTLEAEFVPNQVQIDGTQVNLIRTSVHGAGAGNATAMMAQDAFIAASGPYTVQINSTDATAMGDALAALKKTDGLGVGDPIAQARVDYLPADPAAELYLNPKGLETGVNIMFMMMGGQPVSLPEDLPPLTAGLNVGDGAAHGRLVLPMRTILYVSDLVRQTQAGPQEEEPSTAPDTQEDSSDQGQMDSEPSDQGDRTSPSMPRSPFSPAAPR
ncbi:MAG: hypothetical protein IT441_00260 [Phycisphaeraceae bacterium]|nr:hypothetical protein [Phycisphaeraceae bacterium]